MGKSTMLALEYLARECVDIPWEDREDASRTYRVEEHVAILLSNLGDMETTMAEQYSWSFRMVKVLQWLEDEEDGRAHVLVSDDMSI